MPTKNFRMLREQVAARPGAEARIAAHKEAALAELGLYALRRSLDVSQVELAGRLEITQSAISKLENAEDLRLSTLRGYIEALGGQLELTARFNDKVVALEIVPNTAAPTSSRARLVADR